ncbi:MAG: hypothetical protein IKK83_03100 [Clostridia bacterium]|nr:hypothetical protein [Clostridia bacterium]
MGVFSVFGGGDKGKGDSGGAYYRRLSIRFTICKFSCLLLLILVVLYGFSFRTDEINMDNFRYLFNSAGSDNTQVQSYRTLYFDSSDSNRFALVRGDLAVVNNSGSAVYGLGGERKSADSTLRMDDPHVISSAKFMYIYDLGGTELVVKNTLETVSTLRFPYAIRDAVAADGGYFAVVSSEKTTRSTIFVYDDRYREVYKCSFGSQYTLSVDLNEDATQLITASVYSKDGIFVTAVELFSLSEKKALSSYSFEGEYPYRVYFTEDGGFMLMTDAGLRIIDSKGDGVAFLEFGDLGIDNYYMDGNCFIKQYSPATMSAEEFLEYYDASGKLVYENSYANGIRHVSRNGNYLFVISGSTMYMVRLSDGTVKETEAAENVLDTVFLEDGKVLILTAGTGSVLEYEKLFDEKITEVSE